MWLNPEETADLVTFTEETLNGEFHFLCGVNSEYTSEFIGCKSAIKFYVLFYFCKYCWQINRQVNK